MKELKDYKYTYWHRIVKVDEAYGKKNPHIKVGLHIGRGDKYPYGVCIMDLEKGIEYGPAYVLDYVGRLPSNTPDKEVIDFIKKNDKDEKQS